MAPVTRTLKNTGEPLIAPDGTLLAGVAVTFTLVSPAGAIGDVWDATTHERVVGVVTVTTDNKAEFSVELWPNSRGNRSTMYLCQVAYAGVRDFKGGIDDLVPDLTWAEFMAAGFPLTTQELTALGLHLVDPTAAHAASAISISAISGVAASDVQAALANLAARIAALEP